MYKIEILSEAEAQPLLPQLVNLLKDAVDNGSSVGFLPPLDIEIAREYWQESLTEISECKRVLLVAIEDGKVAGSAQLGLATKPNSRHRAEVQKVIVHTEFRNRGIAKALMDAIEKVALEIGRTLLVLDTEQHSVAEKLYEKCGYIRSGVIPQYALSADGSLITTVVFYKILA